MQHCHHQSLHSCLFYFFSISLKVYQSFHYHLLLTLDQYPTLDRNLMPLPRHILRYQLTDKTCSLNSFNRSLWHSPPPLHRSQKHSLEFHFLDFYFKVSCDQKYWDFHLQRNLKRQRHHLEVFFF
jgi:hypothetical protein